MAGIRTIEETGLRDKRVLVRVDFNVPLRNGAVADDTRIRAHIPTIKYILSKGARSVILISHLGRPKDAPNEKFSLKVVTEPLEKLLGRHVSFFGDCIGEETVKGLAGLEDGGIALLENLRFHGEEKKNDEGFAKKLASYADIFIQDAFAVAHRAHASTVGITKFLPSAAGFLIQKEVKFLSSLLGNPERPFTAVLGGAKVSTKISVLSSLLEKADNLLIGGAMSYTFLKAKGENIGNSLFEEEFLEKSAETASSEKLHLPVDHIVSRSPDKPDGIKTVKSIPDGFLGVDIGPETVENYSKIIRDSKTIFWNGPMGIFEVEAFSKGTRRMAEVIADATEAGAVSVAGGGDSVAAIKLSGRAGSFSHISTGGGASLEFVEGKALPGIEALK